MTKQTEAGALLAVSRDYYENGRDAMQMAAQILNGESPGDIPFRIVGKTQITLNTTTLNRLGLTLPESTEQVIDKKVN